MILPDGYSDVPAGKIAAVVTHLEMTERPALPPDPHGAWTLRRVESPALDWYRDLYRRVGEEWLWFSRMQMADAGLAAIVHAPLVEIFALVHEGRDEGLLELDFRDAGQCEIAFFGVTAKLVGSGAGRWLMNRALQLAWSRPITRLWVHTCTLDHPSALAFYERAGFRPFRRQVEIADDPRLDGAARCRAACADDRVVSAVIAREARRRAIQYSRDVNDRTEKPRRTGYSAFAEYDEVWLRLVQNNSCVTGACRLLRGHIRTCFGYPSNLNMATSMKMDCREAWHKTRASPVCPAMTIAREIPLP